MVVLALAAAGATATTALGLGPGVGWAGGMLIGSVIMNRGNTQTVQGGRLRDLTVQDSAAGKPIPILYGACRVSGELIWVFNNQIQEIEIRSSQNVGKGGGQKIESTSYQYRGSFAIGLGEGPIVGVSRIWMDSSLVYGAVPDDVPDLSPAQDQPRGSTWVTGKGNTPPEEGIPILAEEKFRVYRGTEDQTADPLMEEDIGAGLVPGFRGLAYIVFEDLDLTPFGGRIPAVSVEVGSARRRWLSLGFEPLAVPPAENYQSPTGWTLIEDWPETAAADSSYGVDPRAVSLDGRTYGAVIRARRVYSTDTGAGFTYRNFLAHYDKQDGYIERSVELYPESPSQALLANGLNSPTVGYWNQITNKIALYPGDGTSPIEVFATSWPGSQQMTAGLFGYYYAPLTRAYYIDGFGTAFDVALLRINGETGGWQISDWERLSTGETGNFDVMSNKDSLGERVYLSWRSSTHYDTGIGPAGHAARTFVYSPETSSLGAPGSPQLVSVVELSEDYGICDTAPLYPGDGCQMVQGGVEVVLDPFTMDPVAVRPKWLRWQHGQPLIGDLPTPSNVIHTYVSTAEGSAIGASLYQAPEIWWDEYTQAYYAVGAASRGNSSYRFQTSNPERAVYPEIGHTANSSQSALAKDLAVGNLYKLDRSFEMQGQIDGIANTDQWGAGIQGSLLRFGRQYIAGDVLNPGSFIIHDVDLETMTLLSSVDNFEADADEVGDDAYGAIGSNQFVHSTHKQGAYWWTNQGISFPDLTSNVGETTLADIVADISVRCNLAPDDFDVSELTDIVRGATLPRRDTGANHLVQFMMAYAFDPCEEDWRIVYKKRDRPSVAAIPLADLAAGSPGDRRPSMQETIPAETGLPRSINVQVIDRWRDYQPNDARAWRDQSVVITAHQTTAEMSIVFDGLEEPRAIAQRMIDELYGAHMYEFSLGPRWGRLAPGDVVTVTHVGAVTTLRLLEVADGADMTIRCQGVKHDQAIYVTALAGDEGYFVAASLPPLVPAEMILLDVPSLRDCDIGNLTLTGFVDANFLAVAGAPSSRFQTATLYRDDKPALVPLVSIARRSIIGRCLTKLRAAPAAVVDTTSRLRVELLNPADALESVSIQQAIDYRNAALVGTEADGWELICFASAAQQADGTWLLSNIVRGGRGTDAWIGTHKIGQTFILLDPSRVQRVEVDFVDIGTPIDYRAVSAGQSVVSTPSGPFADNGNKLRPWAPVLLTGAREA